MKRIVLILAFLLGAPAMAQEPAQMTITGRGEVAAVPDMATIQLGVVSEARDAAAAMAANSADLAAVLAILAESGITGRDVQTRQLTVDPIWENSSTSSRAPGISGFQVTNLLAVRVRDLDRLGAVLDAAVRAGANSFRGLSFGLADPTPVMDEARRAAVADATHRATLYAEAAGFNILGIRSFSEAGDYGPQPQMMAMAVRSVPVAEGEVTLSASVTIVYDID